jgi:L-aspartate oxidase
MPEYHKSAELAPRDVVSRAMVTEQQKGPVLLDIRHRTAAELQKQFPTIYRHLKQHGYKMEKDLIPITPAAHYLCGGVVTDVNGGTGIQNLFAVGEIACTGLQGANRLASNSLLEAAVMSEHVMDSPLPELDQSIDQAAEAKITQTKIDKISPQTRKNIAKLKAKLQKCMWKNVGIVRTNNLLMNAVKQVQSIKKQLPKRLSIPQLELQNMLLTGELTIKAALQRKKSLGAHFRKN